MYSQVPAIYAIVFSVKLKESMNGTESRHRAIRAWSKEWFGAFVASQRARMSGPKSAKTRAHTGRGESEAFTLGGDVSLAWDAVRDKRRSLFAPFTSAFRNRLRRSAEGP